MTIHQTVRKTIGKSTIILSAIALSTMSVSAAPILARPDFSGEWKLNEQKSELGQFAQMSPTIIKVESTDGAMAIERHSKSMAGEDATNNEKLTFDGKATETSLQNNFKRTSTAKWSDDGQTLTVNSTIVGNNDGQQFEVKQTQVWKLLDNKSLSIESNSVSSFGTFNTRLIYDKVTK